MSVSMQQNRPAPAEVWAAGDYPDVMNRMIPGLGAWLVELAGVRPGEDVLDVAAGTGNAAVPAAAVGAAVTALDITPALLEAGRRSAAAAGLDVTWVHGDAQALPFTDASFDCVLSCVGVQFCADHQAAATELARVCRPGGRIALTAWTPEGFIGQVLKAVATATGAAGLGPSPLAWGREGGIEQLFDGQVEGAVFLREELEMPASSPAGWVDFMADAYGPMTLAREALAGRGAWSPLREQLIDIAAAHDAGRSDGFAVRAEYLGALLQR